MRDDRSRVPAGRIDAFTCTAWLMGIIATPMSHIHTGSARGAYLTIHGCRRHRSPNFSQRDLAVACDRLGSASRWVVWRRWEVQSLWTRAYKISSRQSISPSFTHTRSGRSILVSRVLSSTYTLPAGVGLTGPPRRPGSIPGCRFAGSASIAYRYHALLDALSFCPTLPSFGNVER